MDLNYTPVVFDLISLTVAVAPVVLLAALAVVDLRALMLLRAMRMMKHRLQPGEQRISRDEWSAAV